MSKPPLITIGLITYNAQDTAERALKSALKQNWENKEIIIVDDCSTDKTISVLKPYINARDVKLIQHSKNNGVAVARNSILKHAKGEFIAFFDDDDVSDPQRLQKQYDRIINFENTYKNKSLSACYTTRKQIYPDGVMRLEYAPGLNNDFPHGIEMAKRILWGKPMVGGFGSMATCSLMARKDVFEALNQFDATLQRNQDTDFAIRLALKGGYFLGLREPLVTQTMTYGSEKTLDREQIFNLKILEKHKSFIDQHFSYSFCEAWTRAKFFYLKGQKAKFINAIVRLGLNRPLLTLKKIMWALPNKRFNQQLRNFHQG